MRASPTCSWSSFLFSFGISIGSCNNSSGVSEMYGFRRACLSSLSLDSIAGWWSERSISWPDGVVGVEVDELEEVVGKPGTAIGTKFSVLHCIRMPVLMRCGFFDRWSIHVSIRFRRQQNSSPFCWSYASTRRSRQQFLVPLVQLLKKSVDTNSPKVRRMLLNFSPLIFGYFWPASTLLYGHLALAFPSLLETDPQILERWGYADEVHLGKCIRAKDHGLECWRDATRLWWIVHIGLASVCLSSSAESMKTSAAPYPEIRNPIVVCSSIQPLQFCHHSFETSC